MNQETRDEVYSILHEVMLSDYEFSRNYRNFLEVSNNYFRTSAANNRNMHSILDRMITLENDLQQQQNQTQRQQQNQTQRQPYTNARRFGSFNQYANHSVNNLQETVNPTFNRNQQANTTTNSTNLNSFWTNLWGNSNTHTRQTATSQNINRHANTSEGRRGTRNRNMETSNFITLLSNRLLQNELSNSQLQRERMPTEQEIDNACEVLLYRDCSSNNQTRCPIDMLDFEPDDSVMRITHCGHIFREANLRRNFQTSSCCPMCRHNIVQNNNVNSGTSTNIENTNVTNNNTPTRENSNSHIDQTLENSNTIITSIMNQIRDNPNTFTGNESFLDASGNNVSIEYSVSPHFI